MSIESVAVILVNYNTEGYIHDNIDILDETFDEVIIVDNSENYSPISKEVVLRYGNVGFGVGCNLGARFASSDRLLFLNPDFHLDRNGLAAFISAACQLSPSSLYVPLANNGYWDLTLDDAFIKRISRTAHGQLTRVNFLSGCCFFSDRHLFLAEGGFDNSIFMYCEDLELSLRLKNLKIKLFLLPFNVGTHVGGGSFQSVSAKVHRLWLSFTAHRKVLARFKTEPLLTINSIYLALGIR